MGRGVDGGKQEDYIEEKDAKHVLDSIGKIVHGQVNAEAETYKGDLKGSLSFASIFDKETSYTADTCELIKKYYEGAANSNRYPCGNGKEQRFSKERDAKYDEKKIGCSNSLGGACAPLRRLSVCNKNLENINEYDRSKAKNDLLADVCLAANIEGESLKTYHDQYELQYPSSGLTMCTELARSFADIGDIIRGRDLYIGKRINQNKYGNEPKTEREKLENKLKGVFEKIYNELTSGRNTRTNGALQARYGKDGNFFQLREDWWTANRETVWKAITCDKENKLAGAHYFRGTCNIGRGNEKTGTQAKDKCRCSDRDVTIVPTYFDYVPQYLRWFEEWAEDFCRKKKKKLPNVKNKCRGKTEGEKYCSLNGCDCTKTIRARGKLRYGNRCIDCLYACNPYVHWIDKKKEEFDKQKKKYEEEIKKADGTNGASHSSRKKRDTTSNKYDGYEKKFYEKLQSNGYGSIGKFLEKLSDEEVCKNITTEEEGTIDFNNTDNNSSSNKTFYHSQYCQPCPYCGMKKKSHGSNEWVRKHEDDKCKSENLYEPKSGANPTPIKILKSGEKHTEIENKLNDFCNKSNSDKDSLYEEWKCYKGNDVQIVKDAKDEEDVEDIEEDYQNVISAGGLCILENNEGKEKVNKQKTFNDFFHFWVAHMLKDSIHWRTKKLKGCLKNGKTKCGNETCKNDCGCFERWVDKKKDEWDNIKSQFGTQDDIQKQTQTDPIKTLELVLEAEYLDEDFEKKSKTDDEDAKEMKHLQEIMSKKNSQETAGSASQNKTIIDLLLKHEAQEATKCLQTQEECNRRKQEDLGRALRPSENSTPPKEEEEEDDFFENLEEDKDEELDQENLEEQEEAEEPKVDNVTPACTIVSELFTTPGDTFTDACKQKYAGNQPRLGWKCIDTTTKPGDKTTGSSGSICVPPRRRKLYVAPLSRWAEETAKGSKSPEVVSGNGDSESSGSTGQEAGSSSSTEVSQTSNGDSTESSSSTSALTSSRADNPLLAAFVESAAVETFFLWHNYKELNGKGKTRGGDEVEGARGTFASTTYSDSNVGIFSSGSQSEMRASSLGPIPPVLPVPPGFPPGPQIPLQILSNGGSEKGELDDLVGRNGGISSHTDSEDSNNPQKELQQGKIPNDFLKQMFYTIADYRDILFGNNTDIVSKALSDEDQKAMQKIKEKIKQILPTSGSSPSQTGPNHSLSAKDPSQPSDKRKDWWSNNAPSIWEAMICALTYEDKSDGARGQLPQEDEKVKEAFFGDKNDKPDSKTSGATTGTATKDQKYDYNKVELKEENETGAITPGSTSLSGDTPTLDSFVKRPPYFRYLEEWGENFCGTRKRLLKDVKDNCRTGIYGERYSSGDGEECTKIGTNENKTFNPFDYSSCANHCRSYKRWIEKKRTEYEKLKNAYEEQKSDAKSNSDKKYDETFVQKLSNGYESIKLFLEKLKDGPCKTNSEEDQKGNGYIKFDDDKTFGHENYCDPCPVFGVRCKGDDCSKATEKECIENGKKIISAEDIETMLKHMEKVDMLVSDNGKNGFQDLQSSCEHAGIFNGIRKDEWKCGNLCNSDVCVLKTFSKDIHDKKNVLIRTLFIRWLEYFLKDYNRIQKKLKPCMNNGEANICTNDCPNKCHDKYKCVGQWIEKKKIEWPTIRARYLNPYVSDGNDTKSLVTNVLEILIPQIPVVDDKGKHDTFDKLKTSLKCYCPENSKNEDGTESDIIDCMLKKLKIEAEKCQQHQNSVDTPASCQEYPPLPDEKEEENTVTPPQICGYMKTQEPEQPAESCNEPKEDQADKKTTDQESGDKSTEGGDPAETKADSDDQASPVQDQDPEPEPENQEEKDLAPQAEPAPAEKKKEKKVPKKAKKRQLKPQTPTDEYTLNDVLLPSALPLTVGLSFLALSYWWLKKKTKSSVDLLSVLNIPKGEYDIPTKTSPNRYIPYKSAQYRGKQYIYIEGDSGTDSGYTDQYSDITSSSESEYEEFDINDIYAPGSPKYKTLIEVVLEPSKRDTQNDIPSGDIPNNKLTDNEWNELKQNFISNMLQNTQNKQPNILHDNVDNNTHPTPSRDTLDQKPFIMSIHDRNLYTGEEHSYDMTTNSGNNDLYSGQNNVYGGIDPTSGKHGSYSDKNNAYSGIDLINDSLSGGNQPIDIYDEILKRKENELFGTNHVKQTSTHSVAKNTNSDPVMNQLDLFHKWLDRHRNMCEKWSNKEELLDKLKELWISDTPHTPSDIHPSGKLNDIPSGKLSGTPSDNNIHSDIQTSDIHSGDNIGSGNKTLNTDVSIQIDMNIPKNTNEFTYVDSNPNLTLPSNPNLVENNINPVDTPRNPNLVENQNPNPTHVQIEMDINNHKLVKEKYPIGDVWDI